jgi:hypothetical protein
MQLLINTREKYDITLAAIKSMNNGMYSGEYRDGVFYLSGSLSGPSADGGTNTGMIEFLKVFSRGEGAEIHSLNSENPDENKAMDTLSRQFYDEYKKLGIQ